MSPTKRTAKRPKKRRPTKTMLDEINEVFKRHQWTGGAIGLHDPDSSAEVVAALSDAPTPPGLAPDPAGLNCVPPAKPTFITIHHPDGTLESGWACL
jgi:hypothetical protein